MKYWSCYPTEELEVVHKRFCKFALGVSRSATNLACYGELGRTPLMIIGKISQIKYWLRVTTGWSIPILVKDAYALAKAESLEWVNCIQNITHPSRVDSNELLAELEQRLIDQYIQSWYGELKTTTGKLRTYKLIKENFKREEYLTLPRI